MYARLPATVAVAQTIPPTVTSSTISPALASDSATPTKRPAWVPTTAAGSPPIVASAGDANTTAPRSRSQSSWGSCVGPRAAVGPAWPGPPRVQPDAGAGPVFVD